MESLTGEWHGHYEQHGAKARIVATLTQEGTRLSGSMADLDPENETPLYDYLAESGLPPGADEEIAAQLRALMPGAPRGPITSRSILPEDSRLEGSVNGRFVSFTKTYQGNCTYSFEVGGESVSQSTEGHAVDYSGQLAPDGNSIAGRWLVSAPDAPPQMLEGDFELHRVEPTR